MTTSLQNKAMSVRISSPAAIEHIYATCTDPLIRHLCESHERLRMELKGAEIIVKTFEENFVLAPTIGPLTSKGKP